VQAVGADNPVVSLLPAVLERHLAVVAHRGDGVAEDVLGVVAGGLVEDLAEVVPHDLGVPVGERAHDVADLHIDPGRWHET